MAFVLSRLNQESFTVRCLQGILMSIALLPWLSIAFAQPAPKVAFFVPSAPGVSPFWEQMTEAVQAAAEDLEIDLKVVYSNPNSYSLKKDGLAALNDPDKPDYFLTGYWKASTQYHLQRAEQLGIRTFIFNSGVAPEERTGIGRPREKYKYWIGQVTPNDLQAGYLLADILIDKAKKTGKTDNGKVHLIAMGGWGEKHKMEEDRYNGLRKRIDEQNDAVLDKFILTGWSQDTAYNELLTELKQYPKVTAIWSAGDTMAIGAVQAAKESGKTPGQDIFIGGIDWSIEGLKAIASGVMEVSMGGHFLGGAEALILIHDFHYGIDFFDESGAEIETPMRAVTHDKAGEYLDTLGNLDWREIDFKTFSRKYNPGLKRYGLSLHSLLESLKPEPAP